MAETLARLTRVFSLGASVVYLLAGTATASAPPALAWPLVAGVLLHVWSHVSNDVMDLPLDLTDPRRAPDPLVRGTVGAATALLVALAALPPAFAVAPPEATWPLVAAVVLVGAYNLGGKSARVPFVADLVQGAGTAALVVAGAAGHATRATLAAAAFAMAYDAMVNGVHGAVRDVANDRARGATTTAVLLGARVDGGTVTVPRALAAYGAALHLACGAALLALPRGPLAAAVTAGLYAAATAMLVRARRAPLREAMAAGTWHLFLLPAALVAAVASRLPLVPAAVAVAAFALPPVAFGLAVRGTEFGLPSTVAASSPARRATARARLRAVVSLTRPGTPLAAAALTVAGAVLADARTWRVAPAAVAVALVVVAANVFNDRCDVAADRVNRPDRPLPSGVLTANDCDRLVLAASLGVLVFAAFAGAVVATAALLVAALAYAPALRRVPGAAHLAVGLLFASPVVYGGAVAAGTVRAEHWTAAVLVTLFVFGRETLKAVPDRPGDLAAGRCTIATALGERAALAVYRGAAAAFCVAAVGAFAVVGRVAYLVAAVALAVVPTLLTLRRVRGVPTAEAVLAAVAFSGNVFALGLVPVLLMG
jgi:4-hydroxybenzoate polyprenyltransferase